MRQSSHLIQNLDVATMAASVTKSFDVQKGVNNVRIQVDLLNLEGVLNFKIEVRHRTDKSAAMVPVGVKYSKVIAIANDSVIWEFVPAGGVEYEVKLIKTGVTAGIVNVFYNLF
jgi:hypothetical protein